MINKQSYQITGMRQDNLVGTGFSSKFAHEIMNLRLNTVGDYTTASWTTEEGTLQKPVYWSGETPSETLALLVGNDTEANPIIPIGQAVLNDQWIVFTTQNTVVEPDLPRIGYDFIFKYWYEPNSDNLWGTILYAGNLNFDAKHPCETLTFYENENVQKVYWTDGKNQPRVINIANIKYPTNLDGQFDFVQEVELKEKVSITKQTSGAGLFPPGTVKYAITYYKKYGQETNIVYDSPLYYPIKGQRGCNPDELSGDSFEIKVTNLDVNHGFDYIRLYSIVRTTENATPIVRIVADKELESLPTLDPTDPDYNPNNDLRYALFVDTNTTGEIVDPTVLQYVGGKAIVAETFDQKNNTLFLGNIEIKTKSAKSVIKKHDLDLQASNPVNKFDDDNDKCIGIRVNTAGQDTTYYQYTNQMTEADCWDATSPTSGSMRLCNGSSDKIKIFKWRETYRFGIQFQDTKGVWSEVVYLKDDTNNKIPQVDDYKSVAKFATFKYTLPSNVRSTLVSEGFVKARLVCCYPNNADRTILAQGVLNPTMFNSELAEGHAPDIMASWFFRPYKSALTLYDTNEVQNKTVFWINTKLNTFNSPEITFDETIRTLDLSGTKLYIDGYTPIESYSSTYHVEAGAPMVDADGSKGRGFVKLVSTSTLSNALPKVRELDTIASFWEDMRVYSWDHGRSNADYSFKLYPFERNGSLNDYEKDVTHHVTTWAKREEGTGQKTPVEFPVTQTAKLESKVFANINYSPNNFYSTSNNVDLLDIQIFDSNEIIPIKLLDGRIYYGNVNTIVPVDTTDEKIFRWYGKNEDSDGEHAITGLYNLVQYSGDHYLTNDKFSVSSVPIPLTYNSTAHAVIKTNDSITTDTMMYSLPIVDIIRPISNRFGEDVNNPTGTNTNNVYLPCGPVVDLRDYSGNVVLKGIEGDHYYMRYDCLKTYSRALDDVNQIVEILSFMCETRINLDGRYDRNRGLSDNTTITNTNFNLINQSYTQSNNFFSYHTLDNQASELDKFANLITWTKDKVSGEDVDTWTNITMASTADAEGTCGKLNKIINANDTLYSFQDHGIAQIGYNEKTALSTEAGVPLEIANSGKFTGLKYLTKDVGCQNKWSISYTKNGVFFIDDSRQELLTISQELTSLSTVNGFDAFLIQQLPNSEHFSPWTPLNPVNFISYYDKLGNDVYYINKNYCLAWNEQSKTFTSFYSYNDVPLMANIGTHLLMWDINTPLIFNLNSQEVTEEITTYDSTTVTTTEEIEHVTDSGKTVIFSDDNYLDFVYYHFIDGSEYNVNWNIPTWSTVGNTVDRYDSSDNYWDAVPKAVKIANTKTSIIGSWLRMVVEPQRYALSDYQWDAHFILSLEFRKNNQPFIIQFEVEGTHYRYTGEDHGVSYSGRKWVTDPKPLLKVRTQNITDVEWDIIRNSLFLGGKDQPTFNIGCEYENANYVKLDIEPWNNIDSSFITEVDGTERELVCIMKLYDLTKQEVETSNGIKYVSSHPLAKWNKQGNPFRSSGQYDPVIANITGDDYTDEEMRYSVTTETKTTTTTTWTPTTTTKTTTHYSIGTSSSNIWAARELKDANGRIVCNNFFGEFKPYWITLACDGITSEANAFPADKVFNNIEYRADTFDRVTNMPRADINLPVFDKKAAYNGYQMYKEFPIDGIRKFNTWRVQLPRATYDINGTLTTTRDRIRNPFCYIKLLNTNSTPLPNRMVLHDLAVYYDMR